MTATISSASTVAALRIRYKEGIEKEDFDKASTLYKLVGRATDFDGASFNFALNVDGTQGLGVDVPTAQASLAQSPNYNFAVTRVRYYSLARVTGEAMKAAKGPGAVMNLWEHEVERATYSINRDLAFQFHRNGLGSRGQLLAASSGVGTPTITLQDDGGINFFSVGMKVTASATDGGALRSAGATATITGLDRAARTLTISGNWTASIALIADGDFLHRSGDGAAGGAAKLLTGVDSWISTGTIFGLTRTGTDVIKLGGQTKDCTGIPLEELGSELATLLQQQGALPPDTLVLNPDEGNKLRKALIARSMYVRGDVKSMTAGISFKGFEVDGPMGPISVVEDITRAKKTGLLTRKADWRVHSLGPCPQILDFDKNEMLRVATDDAYEIRIGMYGNVECTRPVDSIRCTNVGA